MQVSLDAVIQDLCSQLGFCQLWPQKRRLHTHTLHTLLSAQIPGRLRAAENVRDVLQTPVGERVDTSSELPCHLLIGSPASGHKHYVETSETSNRDEEQACNTHYSQRNDGVQAVDVLAMVEDEEQTKAEHSHDVSRQRQEEEEEVAVIPPADAVVHPRTVVVEILHTVVTDRAVGASWRSVEAAG